MIQLRSVERLRKAAENDEGEVLRLLIEEGASLEAQLQGAVKPLPVYSIIAVLFPCREG